MATKAATPVAVAEYQALRVAHKAARKRANEVAGLQNSYKITVGRTVGGMFFSVDAEGDSWEDIFAKLAKKKISV